MRERTGGIAAVAAALVLAVVPNAGAAEVGRLGLGSQITGLVVGADGAWIAAERSDGVPLIGRATAAGLGVTRAGATPEAGTLGPDGQAWFVSGDRLLRTGAGALSPVASLPALELGTYAIASGPDAAVWAMPLQADRLVRVTAAGVVSSSPSGLPDCRPTDPTTRGSSTLSSAPPTASSGSWTPAADA